jgi:4-amino-4-deoxy-L-arabinose transferase-like glycosyltransferase
MAMSQSGLIAYLQAHQGDATYLAATTNANAAAPLILATGKPVMALGGFLGSDPTLTTEQLAARVEDGDVRYFLLGGGPFGRGGGGATAWVQANCALVPAADYGGAAQPSGGDGFGPRDGGGQLYDCGPVQAATA